MAKLLAINMEYSTVNVALLTGTQRARILKEVPKNAVCKVINRYPRGVFANAVLTNKDAYYIPTLLIFLILLKIIIYEDKSCTL